MEKRLGLFRASVTQRGMRFNKQIFTLLEVRIVIHVTPRSLSKRVEALFESFTSETTLVDERTDLKGLHVL